MELTTHLNVRSYLDCVNGWNMHLINKSKLNTFDDCLNRLVPCFQCKQCLLCNCCMEFTDPIRLRGHKNLKESGRKLVPPWCDVGIQQCTT